MSFLTIEKLYTPDEYIALEEAADPKSEYINGRIYAMSGASFPHVIITGNTFREIANQLHKGECRPYGNDMRVRTPNATGYFYPDITIGCGENDLDITKSATLLNPITIIEVLSPSTEAFDRGDKFAHYQSIPSLQEYALISQNRVRVELYTRSSKIWTYDRFDDIESTLYFASIDCHLNLADIYESVEFPVVQELTTPPE